MTISYDECKKGKTYYFIVTYNDYYGAYESFAGADNTYDEVLSGYDENAVMFKVTVAKTPEDEKKEMDLYYRREAFFDEHPRCEWFYEKYMGIRHWIHRKIYWFLVNRGIINDR